MNGNITETALSLDRLYQLLPMVYRQRDEELGGPLRDLLRVITEQVNIVEKDILQLYENWFIETCQDWVVPYISELIGYQPVHEAGDVATSDNPLRNRILIPRREVARTIQSRRRRGTLALLEEVTRDTAGWPSRAVEFFRLLNATPTINSPNRRRGRMLDLRGIAELDLLDGPFDQLAHTVDVRRVTSAHTPGRFNVTSVGLFVWRLNEYPVSRGQAACLEDDGLPHAYTFSFLGNDTPLFARTQPETDPTHVADETNLPVPIRRFAFDQDIKSAQARKETSSQYYGDGKSLQIWSGSINDANQTLVNPVPLSRIVAADLSDWNRYRTPEGLVAVDPALGRIAFNPDETPAGVWVSYFFGFSAAIGGGEYHRRISQAGQTGQFNELDFKDLVGLAKQWRRPVKPAEYLHH